MRSRRSGFLTFGLDRLNIFVPAIMSVGAMFWLAALLQDMFRHRRQRTLEQRSKIAGRGAARLVSPEYQSSDPAHSGLRHRQSYLVTAVTLASFGLYVFIGSYHNYRRDDGYVEHLGWLLASASVVAVASFLGAAAAVATWVRWPRPPRWARAIDLSTPLSRSPIDLDDPSSVPSWSLTSAALLVPTGTLILSLLVATEWHAVGWIDARLADVIERMDWAGALRVFDPMGSWIVALVLLLVVALAALRCRPLAASYPLALAIAFLVTEVTVGLVDRAPRSGVAPSAPDGFPSTHVVFATLLAGLIPLGVAALFNTRRFIAPLRVVLAVGALAAAIGRVHDGLAWPSDVVAGALVGLTLVLWVQWTIDHARWHRLCRGCLWAPAGDGPPLLGLFHFHVSVAQSLRTFAHLSAAVAVAILSVLTITRGIPTSPDGSGFGLDIQLPVQITLIVAVSLGAVISWRWEAAGAIVMAFGGGGLAVFAAMEYSPGAAILVAVMFAVPAFLLWLSWQHRRTMAEILTVAVIVSIVVGGSWAGALAMNDYWFGPTHDKSAALFVAVDRVDWVWLGGLTDTEVSVAVGPAAGAAELIVVARPVAGGREIRSASVAMAGQPTARLRLTGLEPDTEYEFVVEVDGEADSGRGRGSFTSAPAGASSFSFAFSSCARTDSNGAVFDAIAGEDPLFFLVLGDLHYANLGSSDPADHRVALARQLTSPGQAALYRNVPISYVWDDHDYGPNDADATSPSRPAARQAYREMVPHYDLVEEGNGAIYQAFTIGRVRFILTDTRSERTDATMLGARQLEWLIEELTSASESHALVVWGNSVPWIGAATKGGDNWNGFTAERGQIADALAEADVQNLLMLSGDAHMVAFDDGTNSDYSTDRVGGFGMTPFSMPTVFRVGGCVSTRQRTRLVSGSRVMSAGDTRCNRF